MILSILIILIFEILPLEYFYIAADLKFSYSILSWDVLMLVHNVDYNIKQQYNSNQSGTLLLSAILKLQIMPQCLNYRSNNNLNLIICLWRSEKLTSRPCNTW